MNLIDICSQGPVIPVVEIDDAAKAAALAQALLGGGIKVVEVTLRTPAALAAIAAMASVPGISVGAGTVLTAEQVGQAQAAGAGFGVAPGATAELLAACQQHDFALLPGASTLSEVMALRSQGYKLQKFFPAVVSGGTAWLRAVAGPIKDVAFCPTGGITQQSAPDYLALDNVLCVGGSWIATRSLINSADWQQIQANAKLATALA